MLTCLHNLIEEINMNYPSYDTHLQALKDAGHTIVDASRCTNGTANITLIQNGKLKNDHAEMITCIKECEEHTVIINILVEQEYGYDSIPVNSEMFGKRFGSVGIGNVMKHLPTAYTDKITALNYIARNPSNLIISPRAVNTSACVLAFIFTTVRSS